MSKILLVDDEPDILALVKYNLEKEGYVLETAENGAVGVEKAKTFKPDLILLDIMMPEMDGIEACQEIRKEENLANTIIVFLTARGEDYSQLAGYDAGADDYITKPVKPKVLVSKLKALLRRTSVVETEVSSDSTIVIDRQKYVVKVDGKGINLPKKEFELLALLHSEKDRVFTRDFIMNSVWGTDVIVGDRTIDVHIRKLREKIGDNYIKTIKGVGYKFVESED